MSTTSVVGPVATLEATLQAFYKDVQKLELTQDQKIKYLEQITELKFVLTEDIAPQLSSEIQPTSTSAMQAELKKINKELDTYLKLYPEINKQSELMEEIKKQERENQALRNKQMSPVPAP